jgi:hypothetical protein
VHLAADSQRHKVAEPLVYSAACSQGASRSVLVLERCCLQKRRVNPIRSAFPELHPRNGLKVLTRRFVLPTSLTSLPWSAPRLRGRP